MAEICNGCECTPYENVCACPPTAGITVTQPACQLLPDGRTSGNPCFVPSPTNRSYWSYKFATDTAQATRGISSFVIPICSGIHEVITTVREKIDGCGSFEVVPFTISNTDPNFGPAPEGYNWLKVETDGRFDKGVCVEYQLEIAGNYPVGMEAIKVKAANTTYTFSCNGCYLVPECPEPGQLNVLKLCEEIIEDNMATFRFSIEVFNSGGTPVENVQLTDTLLFSTNLTLGNITISDPTLTINRTVPGRILITGNLGTFDPGEIQIITYSVPVSSISGPGRYIIENTASVVSPTSQASDFCELNLSVVQLSADKCCIVSGNQITYNLTLTNTNGSPSTTASLNDTLTIPAGLTVRFSTFSNCIATFQNNSEPVPLNENIVGPRVIDIECNELIVPESGSAHRTIQLSVVSSTVLNATISNTLRSVQLNTGDTQVNLSILNVPITVENSYTASISCTNPCPSLQASNNE
ncbi:hypothetical protein [Thalassobacillus hwangdonensis]|uniref:DUF11 domain-containing protein n=1 Tax=Thalassobacillus hwangdonensis TaxID=546108 RepID=A0ABW3KYN1_9BACI